MVITGSFATTLSRCGGHISANMAFRQTAMISTQQINTSGNLLDEPIPSGHTLDVVKPPNYWAPPNPGEPDPMTYVKNPVISAHAIEITSNTPGLSSTDSVSLSSCGTATHGLYGDMSDACLRGIPLEYLALLRPAAQGAAAVRSLLSGGEHGGTVLVYGATQPAAMAASQLASASGCAVVAIVDGQHSGNEELLDSLKRDVLEEPSIVVPEEYALVRGKLTNLINLTVNGDDPGKWVNTTGYVDDFTSNFLAYCKAYPEKKLHLALSPDSIKFDGKVKDRNDYRQNLDAYLSQYPAAVSYVDIQKLKTYFSLEKYAAFKSEFGKQTTAVITGDKTGEFDPACVVMKMIDDVGGPSVEIEHYDEVEYAPFEFDTRNRKTLGSCLDVPRGGPILGAIITATTDLTVASVAVEKAADNIRAKAEALHFLTESQKNAFAAARGVAALARSTGKDVIVVGGELPGLKTVETEDADVNMALNAMQIGRDGTSHLNYFIQVYRAGDYPIYKDYAIHRAMEELSGPRQIIVTQ